MYYKFLQQVILLSWIPKLSYSHHVQQESSFHLTGHTIGYNKKVLLGSFDLNGHTIGFHPQTQTSFYILMRRGFRDFVLEICFLLFFLGQLFLSKIRRNNV